MVTKARLRFRLRLVLEPLLCGVSPFHLTCIVRVRCMFELRWPRRQTRRRSSRDAEMAP